MYVQIPVDFADSYDSLGDTIPTTDIGMDVNGANESMYPQRIQHKPCAVPPKKPTDDPFISPVSNQVHVDCCVLTNCNVVLRK